MSELVELGKKITAETGHYNGGPPKDFEAVGRDAMMVLLNNGLLPSHKVLDFGCGSLRIGYWLIRFLDPKGYHGIEPVEKGVRAGLEILIGDELEKFKKPSFRFASDNDMTAFKTKFDFVIARSILTHTCPGMLDVILQNFAACAAPQGTFLASYWRVDGDVVLDDSKIDTTQFIYVVGDDLPQDDMRFVAFVKYSLDHIRKMAAKHNLKVEEDRTFEPLNQQLWLKFTKA